MNTNHESAGMQGVKVILSTLWIFVSLNYIYCDFLTNMQSSVLKDLLTGSVAGVQVTPEFLLGSAILLEIPFAMVVLSRVLNYGASRWANIIAGSLMTVVQIFSFFIGSPPALHYVFFSVVEIACDLFIVWYAWKWASPKAAVLNQEDFR